MDLALTKKGLLYDLDFDGRDLATSESLEGSVALSLDVKALEDDVLNDSVAHVEKYSAGWWANSFEESQIGSALWSVKKRGKDYLENVKQLAQKALSWLVSDGVATKVDVSAKDVDGGCEIGVIMARPTGKPEEIVFQKNWEET